MAILKDSGERRDFGTGAFRDVTDGKGRCDLLPLGVISRILNRNELSCIEQFKITKDVAYLYSALDMFSKKMETDVYTLILEVSKQYEDGAVKYGENNWMKGIPLHCYLDSAVRHYLKLLRGDSDEPHLRAFVWNIIGACWTYENIPEMNDIAIPKTQEKKEGKPSQTIYVSEVE